MASVDSALLPLAPKQPEISIDFWPCWSLSSWGKAPAMFSFPSRVPYLLPQRRFAVYKNKRNAVTAINKCCFGSVLLFGAQQGAGDVQSGAVSWEAPFFKRHQSSAEAQTDECVLTVCQVGNVNRGRKADVKSKKQLKVYMKLWSSVKTDTCFVSEEATKWKEMCRKYNYRQHRWYIYGNKSRKWVPRFGDPPDSS